MRNQERRGGGHFFVEVDGNTSMYCGATDVLEGVDELELETQRRMRHLASTLAKDSHVAKAIDANGYVVRWVEYDVTDYPDGKGKACEQTASSLSEAMRVWEDLGAMGQTIFALAEDGSETKLSSYADALAALKAARLGPWVS